VAYAAAISGSTWTLSSFLQAGKPITSFRQDFLNAVTSEHVFSPNAVVDSFLQKIVYKQPWICRFICGTWRINFSGIFLQILKDSVYGFLNFV
jgi:hypothetical protein